MTTIKRWKKGPVTVAAVKKGDAMATATERKRQVAEYRALLLETIRNPEADSSLALAGEIVATLRAVEARLVAAPSVLRVLAETDRELETLMGEARQAGNGELVAALAEASATVGKQVAALAEVKRALKETLAAFGGNLFACEYCGKIGLAKRSDKRYCGNVCRAQASRRRRS